MTDIFSEANVLPGATMRPADNAADHASWFDVFATYLPKDDETRKLMAQLPSTFFPSEEILARAQEKNLQKDVSARCARFVAAVNDLLATKSLLSGPSFEDDCEQFERFVQHARHLWREARAAFERRSWPLAVFLSIVCLEEVGKIAVVRFELAIRMAHRSVGEEPNQAKGTPARSRLFYSHVTKHLLAAGAGALVNARLDRLLGVDRVNAFLDDVEKRVVETLRQECLYADGDRSGLRLPYERVTQNEAGFHLVLAGEVLAEVGGLGLATWKSLIDEVEQFESSLPPGIISTPLVSETPPVGDQ